MFIFDFLDYEDEDEDDNNGDKVGVRTSNVEGED